MVFSLIISESKNLNEKDIQALFKKIKKVQKEEFYKLFCSRYAELSFELRTEEKEIRI